MDKVKFLSDIEAPSANFTSKPTVAGINVAVVSDSLKNPNALTFGSQTYDGSAAKTITAADLGLSGAMKFLGTSTTAISDGSTTKTITVNSKSVTAESGNVVLYNGNEFVWDGSKWEELGHEGSFKVKQTAVSSPSASGTATSFIDTISQDANGNITATKKSIPSASTSAAGLMSASDKSKLDGIASGANKYTLPSAGSSLGGVKSGGDVTISDGVISVNDDSHNHTILTKKPDNFKISTDLPSTYPIGETVFFSTQASAKFNGLTYCTVHTIKTWSTASCMQFVYPYNTNQDTIFYRHSLSDKDVWGDWQTIATKSEATTSAAGLMSATDKKRVDSFAGSYNLGSMSGKTIADLQTALDTWLTSYSNISNASAYFSAANTWVNAWNSGDTTKTISAGGAWTVTNIASYTSKTYTQLRLSSYYDEQVVYVARVDGVWQIAHVAAFKDDLVISNVDGLQAALNEKVTVLSDMTKFPVTYGFGIGRVGNTIGVSGGTDNYYMLLDSNNVMRIGTQLNGASDVTWNEVIDSSSIGSQSVASATKATKDSKDQQIDTTYIKGLSVSGKTITYTKGDNTTGTITTQDTNYYHTSGSWSGLTYTATANGGAGELKFTLPTGTSATTVAAGNHTHKYAGSSSAGGAATSANKVNKALTIGEKSFDGSAAVTITASDLGLAAAMKFLGTSATAITDGATTNPITIGSTSTNVTSGNVVLYGSKEFVWTGSAWEELGNEGSYKVVQTAVSSPAASGTEYQFIDSISQNTQGVITATKKSVREASTSQSGLMSAAMVTKLNGITEGADSVSFTQSATSGNKVGEITINGTKTAMYSPTQTSVSGNAGTATKFASAQSVALTGDVTGSASSQAGWSVATTLANSGVTAGSYGPSANASPAHGKTFSVPYITVDAKGRVTGASTKTITLPSVADGTTSAKGIVQLTDSTSSTSTTTAATPNSVKTAYDKANHSHPYLSNSTKYAGSSTAGGAATKITTTDASTSGTMHRVLLVPHDNVNSAVYASGFNYIPQTGTIIVKNIDLEDDNGEIIEVRTRLDECYTIITNNLNEVAF